MKKLISVDSICKAASNNQDQVFSQDSSLHSSLPTEDTESDDDGIPLKVLYKRLKATKNKTLKDTKPRKQIIIH
jgi:hypothetical protein